MSQPVHPPSTARRSQRRGPGLLGAAALCACLASCASGRQEPGQAPAGGRVAVGALPEREREALHAWRAGEEAWLAAREPIVADPALARFLVDNLVVVLVRSYDAGHLPSEGPPVAPFERARAELVRLAEHSAPVLAELLVVGDGVVAFLAADVLRRLPGELAVPPVAESLEAPLAETRRRAAEVLEKLPDAGPGEARARALLAARLGADPEWVVRAQAARALGTRGGRGPEGIGREAARDALVRALADEDPGVRTSAALGLGDLRDMRAVPDLVQRFARAIRDGAELRELRALQASLRRLTGVQRDLDAAGWRAWLDRNGARLGA